MNKIIFPFCFLLLLIFSCKSKGDQQKSQKNAIADTAKFYPVDQFVKEQIQQVDLGDYSIRKTFTQDSAEINETIDKDAFLKEAGIVSSLAKQFMQHKELYKETVFQDLSTASYTINYTAIDATTPIQRVDVLLSEETNIIKRLFIRELINMNGEKTFRQISWLANRSFQISSPINNNGKLTNEQMVISWDKANK
jgi:hypothetical protein